MKKILCVLLAVFTTVLLSSCDNSSVLTDNKASLSDYKTSVSDVLTFHSDTVSATKVLKIEPLSFYDEYYQSMYKNPKMINGHPAKVEFVYDKNHVIVTLYEEMNDPKSDTAIEIGLYNFRKNRYQKLIDVTNSGRVFCNYLSSDYMEFSKVQFVNGKWERSLNLYNFKTKQVQLLVPLDYSREYELYPSVLQNNKVYSYRIEYPSDKGNDANSKIYEFDIATGKTTQIFVNASTPRPYKDTIAYFHHKNNNPFAITIKNEPIDLPKGIYEYCYTDNTLYMLDQIKNDQQRVLQSTLTDQSNNQPLWTINDAEPLRIQYNNDFIGFMNTGTRTPLKPFIYDVKNNQTIVFDSIEPGNSRIDLYDDLGIIQNHTIKDRRETTNFYYFERK